MVAETELLFGDIGPEETAGTRKAVDFDLGVRSRVRAEANWCDEDHFATSISSQISDPDEFAEARQILFGNALRIKQAGKMVNPEDAPIGSKDGNRIG